MRVVVVGVSYAVTTLPVDGFPIEHTAVRQVHHGVTSSVAGPAFLIGRTLAALGDEVYLASPLGEDAEGAMIDAAGYAYGVNTAMCPRSLARTPRAVVLEDPSGRRQLNCDLGDAPTASVELNLGALSTAELLVLDGQIGTPLVAAANEAGVPVAVDVGAVTGPPTLQQQAYLGADLIAMSNDQLGEHEDAVLRTWRERTRARLVVLTLGLDGVLAMSAGSEDVVHVPARRPGPVGESARAAYVATLVHHVFGRAEEAAQALAHATAAASIATHPAEREALSEEYVETAADRAGLAAQAP